VNNIHRAVVRYDTPPVIVLAFRQMERSSYHVRWPAAFARFLNVSPARRVSFVGYIIFRVEGGLVTNRMRWPLAEELRRQVDVECSGRGCPDATEILELLRDDIPRLNEARAAVMGAARN
jgi:hypothetical protein